MNERNVAALVSILTELLPEQPWCGYDYDGLANAISSRGVLVPSALTDEEGCGFSCYYGNVWLRSRLDRIAKGGE